MEKQESSAKSQAYISKPAQSWMHQSILIFLISNISVPTAVHHSPATDRAWLI